MADGTNDLKSQAFSGISLTPERRRFARYAVRLQLELRVEGSEVPMRLETTDLSRNGCYVETNMPLAVGTKVQVKLWLAETRLLMRGRVVTSHPQYGNGIMFLEYEGDSEQRLRSFLDSLNFDLIEGYTPPKPDPFKI